MKFTIGLAIGFAAGYWYGSEEQRRQKLEETVQKVRDNPRVSHVTDSVSRNVTKVTDAVETRVTDTADKVGEAAASTASRDTAPADSSAGSS